MQTVKTQDTCLNPKYQKTGIPYRFQMCSVKIKETKIHIVLCVFVDKEYGLYFTRMERKKFKDLTKSLCTGI